MKALRAAWVCPVARPPIADGWVALDGPRIHSVGGAADPVPAGAVVVDAPHARVLMPGLVNAHTHLELSWLAGRVPPAQQFTSWLKQLMITRGRTPESAEDDRAQADLASAARDARAMGTIAVGDISNGLSSVSHIARAGMQGVVFHEVLGFNVMGNAVAETRAMRDAARGTDAVRVSMAPHAPYSTSPELFRAVREEVNASGVRIMSVHLGESPEEVEMLEHGTGEWPRFLRMLGAWRDDWTHPGVGPVEYLDAMGVLDAGTLVVHGVQLREASLARLKEIGSTLVTCPRSNQWVGVGAPPIARFYASGVRVAIGTDSLASCPDLNLFAELREMRWLAPDVPAAAFIASATIEGARALGLADRLGSLEAGKDAAVLSVRLPDSVADVEEYLVRGIEPAQVTWA